MPISVNKALGANDRCSPGDAVISAYLSAVIEGDTIVAGQKTLRSRFKRCCPMAN
jgi:hypothetical protein